MFQVEREMDGHWYSMGAPVEADSASKGVAICAVSEGTYPFARPRPRRHRPSISRRPPGASPSRFAIADARTSQKQPLLVQSGYSGNPPPSSRDFRFHAEATVTATDALGRRGRPRRRRARHSSRFSSSVAANRSGRDRSQTSSATRLFRPRHTGLGRRRWSPTRTARACQAAALQAALACEVHRDRPSPG